MENIYGIDLGTTQSCVARITKYGQPEVLTSFEGDPTTPSVVYYDTVKNDVIVGSVAKESWFGVKPESTVAFIKREMPNENYRRTIGDKQITPVNVSAQILKKLVADANIKLANEENLPPIKKVIITIPAYFGDLERRRTQDAGVEAGLEVLELINEPVAAAIWFSKKNPATKTFLVYDLGGGTFDVSIVRKKPGEKPDILCFDGDKQLGGVDWDRALANRALSENGIESTIEDFEHTPDGSRLLLEAEKAKQGLTTSTSVNIWFRYNNNSYNATVHRADFETDTRDLLSRTEAIIDRAIRAAKIQHSDIEDIVMVGGSSRMPMVLNMLQKKFNKEVDRKLFFPDLAVAYGAAIYANNFHKPSLDIPDPILSKSYGTDVYNLERRGHPMMIYNFFYKNQKLPIPEVKQRFRIRKFNQKAVLMGIYENDSDDQWEDLEKGRLVIEEILEINEPVLKGTPVDVFVEVNKSGILHLRAECKGKQIKMHTKTK